MTKKVKQCKHSWSDVAERKTDTGTHVYTTQYIICRKCLIEKDLHSWDYQYAV